MLFSPDQIARRGFLSFFPLVFAAGLFCASLFPVLGQGAVDYTGTGGRHTIQGRIYFLSGRRADAPGLKVKLESMAGGGGTLTLFTDSNGSFSFKNLTAGSYTVVIDAGDDYEAVRETVYIDDPGSSSMRGNSAVGSTPRIFTVPIYLVPKRRTETKSEVVSVALAAAPKAAAELYAKALESDRIQDHEKAVQQLKAALAIYPEFALALNELGVQYLKLGKPDKAAQELATAVKLAPDDFKTRLNYGIALLNQRKFDQAVEELAVALKKNSSIPTAHMYFGIALMSQRKLDQAQQELEAAIGSKSSEVAQAHRYLGGIYWGKREYERAADELETYLKLVPGAADAEQTRGAIRELRGKSGQRKPAKP